MKRIPVDRDSVVTLSMTNIPYLVNRMPFKSVLTLSPDTQCGSQEASSLFIEQLGKRWSIPPRGQCAKSCTSGRVSFRSIAPGHRSRG